MTKNEALRQLIDILDDTHNRLARSLADAYKLTGIAPPNKRQVKKQYRSIDDT